MTRKNDVDMNLIVKAAISFAGILLLKSVLEKVGLLNSSSETVALNSLKNSNIWAFPNADNQFPPVALFDAEKLINQIYDSDNYFNDDEATVFAAFRSLQSQSQIPWLSKYFYEATGNDLYGYLVGFLDDEEMITLKGIIDQKPR